MSLGIENKFGNNVSENLNITEQHQIYPNIERLPAEVLFEIFTYLDFPTLRSASLVNRNWNQIAGDEKLWKKRETYEKAINSKKWAEWFGEEVIKNEDLEQEWNSLPWNIAEILEGPCPIFQEKKVVDTHILVWLPKTLNGGLTLKSLGKLTKKYFPHSDTGYGSILREILNKVGDKSIKKSQWVLMIKEVLPGSQNKIFGDQLTMIADLAKETLINYEVPGILESTACILSYYFSSKKFLFRDTWTRCEENVSGYKLMVGNFDPTGLKIFMIFNNSKNIGIATLRKF